MLHLFSPKKPEKMFCQKCGVEMDHIQSFEIPESIFLSITIELYQCPTCKTIRTTGN